MKKNPKICFVSSSGGHWEQLQKLKPLADKYEGFFVTEKTQFDAPLASYFMMQTDLKDKLMPFKMLVNSVKALKIWIKEKPDLIISQAKKTKKTNSFWTLVQKLFKIIQDQSSDRLP